MQIFFDFDGTLINSQPRLYRLFCDMCPENHFSYEEYCDIKRQRVTQAEMLKNYFNYEDDKIEVFHKQWLAQVEDPDKMLEDAPFSGITGLLKGLSRGHSLYVVTNRQSKEKTIEQVMRCGWEDCFTEILVTEQKQDKVSLIKRVLKDKGDAVVIGDTGDDMKAAKALELPVIAVSWGVIHPDLLAGYKPDFLVHTVEELKNTLIALR